MNKLSFQLTFTFVSILFAAFLSNIIKENYYKFASDKKHRSDAFEALAFLNEMRSFPNDDITPNRFYKSFAEQKAAIQKSSLSLPVWQSLGPSNVPGRMIALAINPKNPKTLYAGSATGGVWRTFNSTTGSNWHRITTSFPVLGVMAIAIDPADTNTIYIGTGEVYGYKNSIGGYTIRTTRGSYGIGILKTTDAGKTWSKSLDWSFAEQKGIQKIVLNPSNSKVIYVGTSEGTYKSTDKGTTWKQIHTSPMVQDIIVNPNDTSLVLISCGNLFSQNSGVYYSSNSGNTWTKSTFPTFTGKTLLESFSANPNIVFASVGDSESGKGLYRSDDFGKSWRQIHNTNVQDYQGFFAHWVAVHPQDINQVIHAGVNMYKSNNAGVTLKTISGLHVDHHNYAHDPKDPNLIYVANDGGVYRSTNFGESYTSIGSGLVTAQFYNGFSNSQQDSSFAIGGLQDNNSVIFSGSKNWRTVISGDGCWAQVNPLNDQNVFGSWQYNRLVRSTNRGQTFTASTTGMTADAGFASPFCIAPSNTNVLYSGRKIIYKSTDNGINWKGLNNNISLDGNFALAMDVFQGDENVVYVTTAPTWGRAGVFLTTDGGTSWMNITSSLPNRYPMDIAIDPNDKRIAYVVFGGYDSPKVFKTIDAGSNWVDISGNLPNVPTLSIAIDPFDPTNIYVGNDLGVFFTYDEGKNWLQLKEGLPEAIIAMELSISKSNKKLRLASHGNGVYQMPLISNKKGLMWIADADLNKQLFVDHTLEFNFTLNNESQTIYNDTIKVFFEIKDASNKTVYTESKLLNAIPAKSKIKLSFGKNFLFKNAGNYFQTVKVSFLNKLQNDITLSKTVNVNHLPTSDALSNCYPNPFNSQTKIEFKIAEDSKVQIELYDSNGKLITKILDKQFPFGNYKITLDAGKLNLSSGIYFVHLRTNKSNFTKKIVYLK